MDLNFCASTAIEFMHRHHTRSLPQLPPLLLTSAGITTVMVVVFILFMLAMPLLLRWHHAWLIASWNMTAVLFFVPGRPSVNTCQFKLS